MYGPSLVRPIDAERKRVGYGVITLGAAALFILVAVSSRGPRGSRSVLASVQVEGSRLRGGGARETDLADHDAFSVFDPRFDLDAPGGERLAAQQGHGGGLKSDLVGALEGVKTQSLDFTESRSRGKITEEHSIFDPRRDPDAPSFHVHGDGEGKTTLEIKRSLNLKATVAMLAARQTLDKQFTKAGQAEQAKEKMEALARQRPSRDAIEKEVQEALQKGEDVSKIIQEQERAVRKYKQLISSGKA